MIKDKMGNQNHITLILPVYGRQGLLKEALTSIIEQEEKNWRLVIADDCSDSDTKAFISKWINDTKGKGVGVQWEQRQANEGLFANLNKAILNTKTEWITLVCSDDLLLPSALTQIKSLTSRYSEAQLILSTFQSINESGRPLKGESQWYHDKIRKETGIVSKEGFIPALLQWGSLNGNLTGMTFTKAIWEEAGGFKETWRHAADWEWLLRAAEKTPVLLNRTPIAKVRTHEDQLSNTNRKSGDELVEVAAVVKTLKNHPLLVTKPQRIIWAAHIMQFQLWNILKKSVMERRSIERDKISVIQDSGGLARTVLAMAIYIPIRVAKRISKVARQEALARWRNPGKVD